MHEIAHIANGIHPGNCTSIIQVNSIFYFCFNFVLSFVCVLSFLLLISFMCGLHGKKKHWHQKTRLYSCIILSDVP